MRAVTWYRGRPPEERGTMEERLVATWSFEILGSYREADALATQLVAEDSANVDFRGELAGLAAERGDTALADSLDRWLAAQPRSRVGWSASVYRARVAALLGRRDVRDRANARGPGRRRVANVDPCGFRADGAAPEAVRRSRSCTRRARSAPWQPEDAPH